MALRTDYKDDILENSMNGKRLYRIALQDGTFLYGNIEDYSLYSQQGDVFGAKDINETNEAVNNKLPKTGGTITGELVIDAFSKEKGVALVDGSGNIINILRFVKSDDNVLIIGDGLLNSGKGQVNISGYSKIQLIIANERLILEPSDTDESVCQFRPQKDNMCMLGTATKRFSKVYAGNSAIQTSDAREKENVIPLGGSSVMALSLDETTPLDIHSELFDRLQPVQYNFINGDGRICYGLIAQDVLSSMESLGIGENELDLVHHEFHVDKDSGEEKETFGIAYNNLIAMLIHEMQKSKMQIATLQAEINALKGL